MNSKAHLARCDECPFAARTFVPPRGQVPEPDFALVGEAPGYWEAKEGKPFVGRSGELLQRTLDKLPIKVTTYLTNAAMCQPPGNKIVAAAVHACHDRLIAELRQVRPKMVIALGNSALNSIMGVTGEGITKRRGRIEFSRELNCPVMATFHPAAVLRNPKNFQSFASDLIRAVKPPEHDYLIYPIGPQEINVLETPTDAIDFIEELFSNPIRACALDLETTGLDAFRERILCAVLSNEKGRAWIIPDDVLYSSAFIDYWLGELPGDICWIGHNAKFDQVFLKEQLNLDLRFGFDTMLAHYAFDERSGMPIHGLKPVAAELLRAPDWERALKVHIPKKKARKTTSGYGDIAREHLYRYAAFDADYTWRLYLLLKEKLNRDQRASKLFYGTLMPLANALVDVEHRGIQIDLERQRKLDTEYRRLINSYTEAIRELAEKPELNPRSTQQMAVVLFDDLKLPQVDGRSTAVGVLDVLEKRHPIINLLKRHRKVTKFHGTYIKKIPQLLDHDSVIHTNFNVHGTSTGRLSSSDPNLQNIPRIGITPELDIRSQFVARPGMVFIHADYSQAEYRVFAWLTKDPYLMELYRAGGDMHSGVAESFFGGNFTKEQRVVAKTVNFRLIYGGSAGAIARDPDIREYLSPRDARRFVREYFRRIPTALKWSKARQKEARQTGQLTTIFGRRRHFGLITRDTVKHINNQAANFDCQSIAGDLTLKALTRLHKRLGEAYVILTMHDSIIVECVDDPQAIVETAKLMRDTMLEIPLEAFGSEPPFQVDIETGYRWGELHTYNGGQHDTAPNLDGERHRVFTEALCQCG